MTDRKDSNPKTAFGTAKPSMEFVPPVALLHLAEAMRHGASKYGAFNWREIGVSETTYYSAIHRHLGAWFDGQEVDPESGCHHLAHVMACCAILFDAESIGKLNPDRPQSGNYAMMLFGLTEARKQQREVGKHPGLGMPYGDAVRVGNQDGSLAYEPDGSLKKTIRPKRNEEFVSLGEPYRRSEWSNEELSQFGPFDVLAVHWAALEGCTVNVKGRVWQKVSHEVHDRAAAYIGRSDEYSILCICESQYHSKSWWVLLRK